MNIELENRRRIFEKLNAIQRLRFGFYPTPLEEMPRLRTHLGENCPRIFVKRDDYTGFAFGGNKIRKLEYVFARLVAENVEAVVTTGGERSNHARATAAFCARLGIECHLALDCKPRPEGAENLKPAAVFLEEIFGAKIHLAAGIAERNRLADDLTEKLRAAGKKVFRIPLGGALGEGALGFVRAMNELKTQGEALETKFDHLFFSSSTGGTHAGMILGKRLFGFENLQIHGIAPEPDAAVVAETKRLLIETGELLEFPVGDLTNEIEISGDYAGAGYCIETPEANRAQKLAAATEAVVLDSVYTAKAFAALVDWIEKGRLTKKDTILFWHTGGQPTLFYAPL